MDKVFVVAWVDYEDYHPWSSYATKEEANKVAEGLNLHDKPFSGGRSKHWIVDEVPFGPRAMPPEGHETLPWMWR